MTYTEWSQTYADFKRKYAEVLRKYPSIEVLYGRQGMLGECIETIYQKSGSYWKEESTTKVQFNTAFYLDTLNDIFYFRKEGKRVRTVEGNTMCGIAPVKISFFSHERKIVREFYFGIMWKKCNL